MIFNIKNKEFEKLSSNSLFFSRLLKLLFQQPHDGRCSFENVSKNIMEDERVKKIIANGAKSVGDVFIDYDTYRYAESDIFFDMIHFLREYSTK